jgi:hypothetical protein
MKNRTGPLLPVARIVESPHNIAATFPGDGDA